MPIVIEETYMRSLRANHSRLFTTVMAVVLVAAPLASEAKGGKAQPAPLDLTQPVSAAPWTRYADWTQTNW